MNNNTRTTISPLLNFAISPELTVSGGVGITELDPFVAGGAHRMANVAIGSIDYSRKLETKDEDQTHTIDARFLVRGGSRSLESDLAYTRYLGQGSYRYDLGRHHVLATGMAGCASSPVSVFAP